MSATRSSLRWFEDLGFVFVVFSIACDKAGFENNGLAMSYFAKLPGEWFAEK
jgi:hypothetical protein